MTTNRVFNSEWKAPHFWSVRERLEISVARAEGEGAADLVYLDVVTQGLAGRILSFLSALFGQKRSFGKQLHSRQAIQVSLSAEQCASIDTLLKEQAFLPPEQLKSLLVRDIHAFAVAALQPAACLAPSAAQQEEEPLDGQAADQPCQEDDALSNSASSYSQEESFSDDIGADNLYDADGAVPLAARRFSDDAAALDALDALKQAFAKLWEEEQQAVSGRYQTTWLGAWWDGPHPWLAKAQEELRSAAAALRFIPGARFVGSLVGAAMGKTAEKVAAIQRDFVDFSQDIAGDDQHDLGLLERMQAPIEKLSEQLQQLAPAFAEGTAAYSDYTELKRQVEATRRGLEMLAAYFAASDALDGAIEQCADQRERLFQGKIDLGPENYLAVVARTQDFLQLREAVGESALNARWQQRLEKKCRCQIEQALSCLEDFACDLGDEMEGELAESAAQFRAVQASIADDTAQQRPFRLEELPALYDAYARCKVAHKQSRRLVSRLQRLSEEVQGHPELAESLHRDSALVQSKLAQGDAALSQPRGELHAALSLLLQRLEQFAPPKEVLLRRLDAFEEQLNEEATPLNQEELDKQLARCYTALAYVGRTAAGLDLPDYAGVGSEKNASIKQTLIEALQQVGQEARRRQEVKGLPHTFHELYEDVYRDAPPITSAKRRVVTSHTLGLAATPSGYAKWRVFFCWLQLWDLLSPVAGKLIQPIGQRDYNYHLAMMRATAKTDPEQYAYHLQMARGFFGMHPEYEEFVTNYDAYLRGDVSYHLEKVAEPEFLGSGARSSPQGLLAALFAASDAPTPDGEGAGDAPVSWWDAFLGHDPEQAAWRNKSDWEKWLHYTIFPQVRDRHFDAMLSLFDSRAFDLPALSGTPEEQLTYHLYQMYHSLKSPQHGDAYGVHLAQARKIYQYAPFTTEFHRYLQARSSAFSLPLSEVPLTTMPVGRIVAQQLQQEVDGLAARLSQAEVQAGDTPILQQQRDRIAQHLEAVHEVLRQAPLEHAGDFANNHWLKAVDAIRRQYVDEQFAIRSAIASEQYKEVISAEVLSAFIDAPTSAISPGVLAQVFGRKDTFGNPAAGLAYQLELVQARIQALQDDSYCTREQAAAFCAEFFENPVFAQALQDTSYLEHLQGKIIQAQDLSKAYLQESAEAFTTRLRALLQSMEVGDSAFFYGKDPSRTHEIVKHSHDRFALRHYTTDPAVHKGHAQFFGGAEQTTVPYMETGAVPLTVLNPHELDALLENTWQPPAGGVLAQLSAGVRDFFTGTHFYSQPQAFAWHADEGMPATPYQMLDAMFRLPLSDDQAQRYTFETQFKALRDFHHAHSRLYADADTCQLVEQAAADFAGHLTLWHSRGVVHDQELPLALDRLQAIESALAAAKDKQLEALQQATMLPALSDVRAQALAVRTAAAGLPYAELGEAKPAAAAPQSAPFYIAPLYFPAVTGASLPQQLTELVAHAKLANLFGNYDNVILAVHRFVAQIPIRDAPLWQALKESGQDPHQLIMQLNELDKEYQWSLIKRPTTDVHHPLGEKLTVEDYFVQFKIHAIADKLQKMQPLDEELHLSLFIPFFSTILDGQHPSFQPPTAEWAQQLKEIKQEWYETEPPKKSWSGSAGAFQPRDWPDKSILELWDKQYPDWKTKTDLDAPLPSVFVPKVPSFTTYPRDVEDWASVYLRAQWRELKDNGDKLEALAPLNECNFAELNAYIMEGRGAFKEIDLEKYVNDHNLFRSMLAHLAVADGTLRIGRYEGSENGNIRVGDDVIVSVEEEGIKSPLPKVFFALRDLTFRTLILLSHAANPEISREAYDRGFKENGELLFEVDVVFMRCGGTYGVENPKPLEVFGQTLQWDEAHPYANEHYLHRDPVAFSSYLYREVASKSLGMVTDLPQVQERKRVLPKDIATEVIEQAKRDHTLPPELMRQLLALSSFLELQGQRTLEFYTRNMQLLPDADHQQLLKFLLLEPGVLQAELSKPPADNRLFVEALSSFFRKGVAFYATIGDMATASFLLSLNHEVMVQVASIGEQYTQTQAQVVADLDKHDFFTLHEDESAQFQRMLELAGLTKENALKVMEARCAWEKKINSEVEGCATELSGQEAQLKASLKGHEENLAEVKKVLALYLEVTKSPVKVSAVREVEENVRHLEDCIRSDKEKIDNLAQQQEEIAFAQSILLPPDKSGLYHVDLTADLTAWEMIKGVANFVIYINSGGGRFARDADAKLKVLASDPYSQLFVAYKEELRRRSASLFPEGYIPTSLDVRQEFRRLLQRPGLKPSMRALLHARLALSYGGQAELSSEQAEELLHAVTAARLELPFKGLLKQGERIQLHALLRGHQEALRRQLESDAAPLLNGLYQRFHSGAKELQWRGAFPRYTSLDGRVAVDVLAGKLYEHGSETVYLPESVTSHATYKRLFGDAPLVLAARLEVDTDPLQPQREVYQMLGSDHTSYRLIAAAGTLAVQRQFEGRWYQLADEQDGALLQAQLPGALRRGFDCWHDRQSLLLVEKGTGAMRYRVEPADGAELAQRIVVTEAAGAPTGLALADPGSCALAAVFARVEEAAQLLVYQEIATGGVQRIDLPRLGLSFSIAQKGGKPQVVCDQLDGYVLAAQQSIPALGTQRNYVVLEKKTRAGDDRKLVLFAALPPAGGYMICEWNFRTQRLIPKSEGASFYLARLYLQEHHYAQAFDRLQVYQFQPRPLAKDSLRVLESFAALSADLHPRALTVQLKAAALLARQRLDFAQEAVAIDSEQLLEDYIRYLQQPRDERVRLSADDEQVIFRQCAHLLEGALFAGQRLVLQRQRALGRPLTEAQEIALHTATTLSPKAPGQTVNFADLTTAAFFAGKQGVRSVLSAEFVALYNRLRQRHVHTDLEAFINAAQPFADLASKAPRSWAEALAALDVHVREQLTSGTAEKALASLLLKAVMDHPQAFPVNLGQLDAIQGELRQKQWFRKEVLAPLRQLSLDDPSLKTHLYGLATHAPLAQPPAAQSQAAPDAAFQHSTALGAAPPCYDLPVVTLADLGVRQTPPSDEALAEDARLKRQLDAFCTQPVQDNIARKELAALRAQLNAYYETGATRQPTYAVADQRAFDAALGKLGAQSAAIGSQLASLKEELELLANLPPTDPLQQDLLEAHRLAGLAAPLELEEILMLFLRRDVQQAQARNPALTVDAIHRLHRLARTYLLDATQKQYIDYLLKLSTQEGGLAKLAAESQRVRAYDVEKHPEYLMLEYASGFRLTQAQVDSLDTLGIANGVITRPENLSKVLELIMGAGKTSMIIPLLAFLSADGQRLAVTILPKVLMESMLDGFHGVLGKAFNQVVVKIDYGRDSPCDADSLERLVEVLETAIRERRVVLMSSESQYALFLKLGETLSDYLEARRRDPAAPMPLAQLESFQRIFSLFKQAGLVTIDEVDLIMDVLRSFHFTIGKPRPLNDVSPVTGQTLIAFYRFIHAHPELHGNMKLDGNPADGRQPFSEELYHQTVKPALIKGILRGELHTPSGALERLLKEADREHKKLIENRLTGQLTAETLAYIDSLTPELQDTLVLLYEMLQSILPLMAPKKLGEHFGLEVIDDAGTTGVLPAPWNRGKPSPKGTQHGTELETIDAAIRLYQERGIDMALIKSDIEKLRQEVIEQRQAFDELDIGETDAEKLFASLMGGHPDYQLLSLVDDDIEEVARLINAKRDNVFYYVAKYVISEIKVYETQLNADAQLFGILYRDILGLTGTAWNADTLPPLIQTVIPSSTAAKTIQLLFKNTPQAVDVVDSPAGGDEAAVKATMEQMLAASTAPTSIIDVANIFRGIDGEEVARQLLLAARAKGWHVEGVGFYSVNDELLVVTERDGVWRVMPLAESGLSKDVLLFYWDQPHTTGSDVKLSATMTAAVTLGRDTFLRDDFQGCWRLRGLSDAQSVRFVVVGEDAPIMQQTVERELQRSLPKLDRDALLLYALIAQAKRQGSDNYRSFGQKLEAILLEKVVAAMLKGAPAGMIDLYEANRSLFESAQSKRPYEVYGQPVEKAGKELVIAQDIDRFLNGLAVHNFLAHPLFSSEDVRAWLEREVEALKLRELGRLPDELARATAYGRERAVQTQTEQSTEKEAQTEKNTNVDVNVNVEREAAAELLRSLQALSDELPPPLEVTWPPQGLLDGDYFKRHRDLALSLQRVFHGEMERYAPLFDTRLLCSANLCPINPESVKPAEDATKKMVRFVLKYLVAATLHVVEQGLCSRFSLWRLLSMLEGLNFSAPVLSEAFYYLFPDLPIPYLPFTALQRECNQVLVIENRATQARQMLLLDATDEKQFRQLLIDVSHHSAQTAHTQLEQQLAFEHGVSLDGSKNRLFMVDFYTGAYLQSDGDDPTAAARLAADADVQRLLVQVKFLKGEVKYSTEELRHLESWLVATDYAKLKTLFIDTILPWSVSTDEQYNKSRLAQLFARLDKQTDHL